MQPRPHLYTLDGHTPVPAEDTEKWCKWFQNPVNRIVAKTTVGPAEVSTVFLGIDHNFLFSGPPLLFETMIFGGAHDQFQERCSTWDEAVAMHARVVELASMLRDGKSV